jgi:hypothetical protein
MSHLREHRVSLLFAVIAVLGHLEGISQELPLVCTWAKFVLDNAQDAIGILESPLSHSAPRARSVLAQCGLGASVTDWLLAAVHRRQVVFLGAEVAARGRGHWSRCDVRDCRRQRSCDFSRRSVFAFFHFTFNFLFPEVEAQRGHLSVQAGNVLLSHHAIE